VHAFRFAISATHGATAREWREKARRVEGLGYDVLLVTDHITAQLAPLPALVAAADATTRLRIGSFVFDNDYRNPVLLAKEAATVDLLSDGRLEFSIGAGWNRRDYAQLGIGYDPPKTRVDRFAEALALIKRLWTEETVDHDGPHYRARGARVLPRPVQRPHPPIMVGGGGPRMLRIAAREADIVALAPQVNARGGPRPRTIGLASVGERIARVRRAAGPRRDLIELNVIVFDARVTDARRSLLESAASLLGWAATAIVRTPFFLYGSRRSLVEDLLERRERLGISYIALPERALESFAPIVAELRGK
jgi:probable F420-dependent oxidoreductase